MLRLNNNKHFVHVVELLSQRETAVTELLTLVKNSFIPSRGL